MFLHWNEFYDVKCCLRLLLIHSNKSLAVVDGRHNTKNIIVISSHRVIVKMLAKNFSEASTQHKNVVDMVNIAVSTCFTDIFIFFRHEMNINFDFLSSYPSALYYSAVQISTFTRSESRATSECQNRTFQRCRSQFESISTTRHTTLDSNPFFSSSQWRELAVSAQCGQRV